MRENTITIYVLLRMFLEDDNLCLHYNLNIPIKKSGAKI